MDEQLRSIILQLESGKRQMEQLSRQAQMIESAILELTATTEALNTLKDQKPGSGVMMPVGAESYMKATLKDTENVLVSIGAGFSVEKKLPDAVQTLEARRKQLIESRSSIQRTMGELAMRLDELNHQAEHMVGHNH